MGLCFALGLALAAQQFAIDVGDLLQAFLDLVVVLNPTLNLLHLIRGHDDAFGMPRA